MMKKVILAVLLIILCLSACQNGNKLETAGRVESTVIKGQEASWRKMTLEEVLANHPLVFKGTCLEEAEEDHLGNPLGKIRIDEIIRGEETDQVVPLLDRSDALKKGETYLVFARKYESVFTQSYSYGGLIWGVNEKSGMEVIIPDLKDISAKELEQKVLASTQPFDPEEGGLVVGAYIHSKELEDIVAGSEYVVKLKVREYDGELADRLIIFGEVLGSFKMPTEETIRVITTKEVKQGAVYYMLLTKPSGGGLNYIISSPWSIYAEDDPRIPELLKLLER